MPGGLHRLPEHFVSEPVLSGFWAVPAALKGDNLRAEKPPMGHDAMS